jgi:hypothetical protein
MPFIAIFVAAVVHVAAGVAVAPWTGSAFPQAVTALPPWYYLLLVLVFGTSGCLLYVGGTRDERARLLGLLCLLFGSLFSGRLMVRALPALPADAASIVGVLERMPLIALEPLIHWRFAWAFPRVQPGLLPRRWPTLISAVTAGTGLLLVVVNVAAPHLAGTAAAPLAVWLSPESEAGVFWQILAVLIAPSLALLVVRLRRSARDDRRRLGWVVWGLVAGTAPMIAHVLLFSVWPAYARVTSVPGRGRWIGAFLTLASLIFPATTAYAVLVRHALDVRVLVRRAVQYALARYTVGGAIAVSVAGLVWLVYRNRHRPLADMLTGSPALLAVLAALVLVLTHRRRLLDAIDRHFFREQYDARHVLVGLVAACQHASTSREVVGLITGEVDRALHVTSIAVLLRDYVGGQFADPDRTVAPLQTDSALAAMLRESPAPLDADSRTTGSPLRRLPAGDRRWLDTAAPQLLVPLFGSRGNVLGLIVLGAKRSELPYAEEDRQMLTAVAASAALSLEQRLFAESPDPDARTDNDEPAARQCVRCGRVEPAGARGTCGACGGARRDALLPLTLAGKFVVEQQIGAGGMGVVYRARDLALDRFVALKVLPAAGPMAVARLRAEARAMATLRHANLAVIHAMESWRASPVLVLEYLAGGTLADRLRFGPLDIRTVLRDGAVLADVLHSLHAAGYLHRDVKPSNIGYLEDGTPRLLDFGLVRLFASIADLPTGTGPAVPGPRVVHAASTGTAAVETLENRVIGTAAYMSPEAALGGPASPATDVWSLALTLYEALSGCNPFAGPTLEESLLRLQTMTLPGLKVVRPDAPQALADLLAAALARDPAVRLPSAAVLRDRLQSIVP